LVVSSYGHVLRKDEDDWVKEYITFDVEAVRPRVRPKKTWIKVIEKHCQNRKLRKEDAMNQRQTDGRTHRHPFDGLFFQTT